MEFGVLLSLCKLPSWSQPLDMTAQLMVQLSLVSALVSASPTALPVKTWAAKYRNWSYYPEFVMPPNPEGLDKVQLVDCATVFELDSVQGYHMTYITFDGVGYQTAMARSHDLTNWNSTGFVYSPRAGVPPTSWNATPGEFDYGGAALIGPLLTNYSMEEPRVLKRSGGSYWMTYYGQPRRNGYELDPGGSGLARSTDGLSWERGTDTPFLATSNPEAKAWEKDCEYAPFLWNTTRRLWCCGMPRG